MSIMGYWLRQPKGLGADDMSATRAFYELSRQAGNEWALRNRPGRQLIKKGPLVGLQLAPADAGQPIVLVAHNP